MSAQHEHDAAGCLDCDCNAAPWSSRARRGPGLTKANEALAMWEEQGSTSLTVALAVEALHWLRAEHVDTLRRWKREATA